MKNRFLLKAISVILILATAVSLLSACGKDEEKQSASPSQSPSSSSNDKAETTAFIAKMGDIPFYENEFYYFFSTVIQEIVYGEDNDEIYKEGNTDDENYKLLVAYLNKKAENSDKTNLEIAIDKTLEICHIYNVAAKLGKDGDMLTDKRIEETTQKIDEEADSYAEYYGISRDTIYEYIYGMCVNDAKRLSVNQAYANAHNSAWVKENGYSFDETEPTAPKKPTEPDDDATDEEKAEYADKLKEYNEKYAEYEAELKKYNDALNKYYEQFRDEYNKNKRNYVIVSVRYLYVSTLDDDGKALPSDKKAEKKADALSYMKLVTDFGYDFTKVIKGFTESDSNDNGFCDLDAANGGETSLSKDIINWAIDTAKVSDELKLFEEDDGYYILQIVGVTDFDKSDGEAAKETVTTLLAKQTVEYVAVSNKYNDYMEKLIKEDKYSLSELNEKRMAELADKYITTTEAPDIEKK